MVMRPLPVSSCKRSMYTESSPTWFTKPLPPATAATTTPRLGGRGCAALKEHRAIQLEERLLLGPGYTDLDLVFCREDGGCLHPVTFTRTFERHVSGPGSGPSSFTASGSPGPRSRCACCG